MASSMFGGIHPASRKENTRRKPLMLLEHPPAQVALPLAFHGGPSSLPLVKAGERVYAGQPIARPEGEDGAVLHASVSGRVEAIRELPHPWGGRAPAIVIANDGDNTPWPERPEGIKLSQASQEELMVRIEAAGIVDMGSDPLPAQVKILRARGRVDTLIVNAAECEPYITADLRLLQERGEPILKGTRALAKVLGVDRVVLAAESDMLTAVEALERCDLIVGYTAYIALLEGQFPDKERRSTGMRREVDRCRMAVEEAAAGRDVALVCSGDSGVYGMAALVYEVSRDYPPIEIEVVPGITAACGGAAVLGAPLTHDFAVVSLSDLMTPWETIENRLRLAARADFVLCLYNPSSRSRADYLQRACDILLEEKSPDTVCGYVRNIGRAGEEAHTCTLAQLRETQVDMFTTVFVGNRQTCLIGGKMVTPRGYLQRGM